MVNSLLKLLNLSKLKVSTLTLNTLQLMTKKHIDPIMVLLLG